MVKIKTVIGARKSALAKIQAQKAALHLGVDAEFVGWVTKGDKIQDKNLRDLGGKELFVREIEQGLLEGKISLAVHSLKDLPIKQPEGIVLAAVLPRDDPRDALVSKAGFKSLEQLPKNATIGTASPRRFAQLKLLREDLEIVLLRGNVDSRVKKIKAGELDAAILAMIGLKRLGLTEMAEPLDIKIMLPAAAQGVICVECRQNDSEMLEICRAASDKNSETAVLAERSFSSSFGASCHVPVAAFAEWKNKELVLQAELLMLDGSKSFKQQFKGTDPVQLGQNASKAIKEMAGEEVLSKIRLGLNN